MGSHAYLNSVGKPVRIADVANHQRLLYGLTTARTDWQHLVPQEMLTPFPATAASASVAYGNS